MVCKIVNLVRSLYLHFFVQQKKVVNVFFFYFDSKHISRVRWSKARLFCQISKFFTFVRRQVQYTTKHFPIISLFSIDLFLQKGKIIFTRLEQKVCFLLYLFSYSLIRELCNSLETSSMKTFYLRSICSYKKNLFKNPEAGIIGTQQKHIVSENVSV